MVFFCAAMMCTCFAYVARKLELSCIQMIKYGVIGTQLLYDDLQYWDSLYIAGRMQKPVLMLKDYAKLPMARKTNLDAAFTLALLLLPQCFSLQVRAAMRFVLWTIASVVLRLFTQSFLTKYC